MHFSVLSSKAETLCLIIVLITLKKKKIYVCMCVRVCVCVLSWKNVEGRVRIVENNSVHLTSIKGIPVDIVIISNVNL